MAEKTVVARLKLEIDSYLSNAQRAAVATRELGREISGVGTAGKQDIERVGRAALVMAGGLTIALGSAAKAAIDWESAFAGVTKTVEGTTSQMSELEDGLRNLASELPATHAEIAAVAEAAGALGIKRSAIVDFTRTMIDLGETTNVSADQAATALAQISNIMGTATDDVGRMGSTLVALGNAGASTESEILELTSRLAAAGKIAGLSEADLFAFGSTLASVGVDAEAGGTALSKLFTRVRDAVIDGGQHLEIFATLAGTSADEFASAFREDPAAAIETFIGGLGRMSSQGESTSQVFKDLELNDERLKRALLSTAGAGDLLTEQLRLGADAWEDNSALQEEAAKRYGTTQAQMEILRNKVSDLGIDLGGVLLPAIRAGVDGLGALTDAARNLPGPVQTAGVTLLGTSATLLGVVGVVGTFGPKVDAASTALKKMGAAGQFVDRNMGRAAVGIGKATVALGAMYAAGQLLDNTLKRLDEADLTKLENALLRLGRGGGLEGEAAAVLGEDLDKLGRALERVAAPSSATQIGHIANELGTLGGLLGRGGHGVDQAAKTIDDLDKALASLAQTSPEDAVAALDALQASMSPEQFDRLLPLLDDYEVSLAALDTSALTTKEGMDGVTTAAEDQEEALKNLKEAISQLLEPLDTRAALDQFSSDLNALTAHFAEADQEVADAQQRMADRQRDLQDLLSTPADQRGEGFDRRVQEARDAIVDAQADIDAAIAGTTRTLEGSSQAAIDNRDLLDRLARDTATAIETAAADETQTMTDVMNLRTLLIAQMEAEAERVGLNKEQVGFYTDALRNIPVGEIRTDVVLGGVDEAIAKLDELVIRMRHLNDIGMGTSADAAQTEKFFARAQIQAGALPEHGEGGVVAGPIGSRQLIIAHGGETVLPTHKPGQMFTGPGGAHIGLTNPTGGAGPVSYDQSRHITFDAPITVTGVTEPRRAAADVSFELHVLMAELST